MCIEFMKKLKQKHIEKFVNGERRRQPLDLCVMATGGGAYKYYDRIKEALGVEVLREDEMECLIIGKSKQQNKRIWLMQLTCDRPRLLHIRNTLRSLYLLRN